jgi:hypothetical protein
MGCNTPTLHRIFSILRFPSVNASVCVGSDYASKLNWKRTWCYEQIARGESHSEIGAYCKECGAAVKRWCLDDVC